MESIYQKENISKAKFDLEINQMNVKTAFLNGDHRGSLCGNSGGCESPNRLKEKKVCKLERALCEIKISSKKWYMKFSEMTEKIGFIPKETEPFLFMYDKDGKLVIMLLYGDDMLMVSNCEEELNKVKEKLMNKFAMTDLGFLREFLGRNRNNRTLRLNQTLYIDKMLGKFGFKSIKSQSTPIVRTQVANRGRKARENDNSEEENELVRSGHSL